MMIPRGSSPEDGTQAAAAMGNALLWRAGWHREMVQPAAAVLLSLPLRSERHL